MMLNTEFTENARDANAFDVVPVSEPETTPRVSKSPAAQACENA